MKITPRVPGGRPLMATGYKYISQRVLGFIATQGAGSTEPGVTYLSRYPDNYYNVSIHPVLLTHVIGRYFIACNTIENQNRMLQSGLALDIYQLTQTGYFRLATTVTLCMGIADGKLLLCHGISYQSKDKTTSMI